MFPSALNTAAQAVFTALLTPDAVAAAALVSGASDLLRGIAKETAADEGFAAFCNALATAIDAHIDTPVETLQDQIDDLDTLAGAAAVDATIRSDVETAFETFRTALSAAILAADSSGTVATFESSLITAVNAITLPDLTP